MISQFQEGFGRLITSGKIMRKLPQDLAFPLGLGSKGSKDSKSSIQKSFDNDDKDKENGIGPQPTAPVQDLDTITL